MSGVYGEQSFEIIVSSNLPTVDADAEADTSNIAERITESLGRSLTSSLDYYGSDEIPSSPRNEESSLGMLTGDQSIRVSSPYEELQLSDIESRVGSQPDFRGLDSPCLTALEDAYPVDDIQISPTPDEQTGRDESLISQESSSEISSVSQLSIIEIESGSGDGDRVPNPQRDGSCEQRLPSKQHNEREAMNADVARSEVDEKATTTRKMPELVATTGKDSTCSADDVRIFSSPKQGQQHPNRTAESRSSLSKDVQPLIINSSTLYTYSRAQTKRLIQTSEANWSSWDPIDSCSPQQSITDFLLNDGLSELKKQFQGDMHNSELWKRVSELEMWLKSTKTSPVIFCDEDKSFKLDRPRKADFKSKSIQPEKRTSLESVVEQICHNLEPNHNHLRMAKVPNGVWEWIHRNRTVRKLVRKAKASFNAFLKTLDPGIDEYFDLKPSLGVTVLTSDPGVTLAVRKGFSKITPFADTMDVHSLPLENPDIPPQPVSYAHGIHCAEMLIRYARDRKFVHYGEAIIVVIPILAEITPGRWHSTVCLFLDDPGRKLSLHLYTQTTPVANEYVNQVIVRTPPHYPLRHLGYKMTVGQAVTALNGVSERDWQATMTDVSFYEQVENAAKALAGMYRNYIDSWIDSQPFKIV